LWISQPSSFGSVEESATSPVRLEFEEVEAQHVAELAIHMFDKASYEMENLQTA
jgi:hypothetical protein